MSSECRATASDKHKFDARTHMLDPARQSWQSDNMIKVDLHRNVVHGNSIVNLPRLGEHEFPASLISPEGACRLDYLLGNDAPIRPRVSSVRRVSVL